MSLKYRPALVESFIDHYATGLYTLVELCKLININTSTYYYWKDNIPEFQEKLKEAEKIKIKNLHHLATKGMVKLLSGLEYTEVSEEYEIPPARVRYDFLDDDDELNQLIKPEEPKPVLKRRYITNKIIQPNANVVMFAMRNLDKENFPDNKELKLDNKQPIPVAFIPPSGMILSFPSNTEDASITGQSSDGNTEAEPSDGKQPTG